MSETPPARKQRWRARPWLWVLLVAALAITVRFYTPRRLHEVEGVRLSIHLSDWRFGTSKTRQGIDDFASLKSPPMSIVTQGFFFGPLHFYRMRMEMEPQPHATNAVSQMPKHK